MDELRRYLFTRISSVDGLVGCVISDRDGVPVLKAIAPGATDGGGGGGDAHALIPDACFRPQFLSAFAGSADQCAKLGLGANRLIVANYETFQVVHANFTSLVLTLVAKEDANTGLIMQMVDTLEPFVKDIAKVVLTEVVV